MGLLSKISSWLFGDEEKEGIEEATPEQDESPAAHEQSVPEPEPETQPEASNELKGSFWWDNPVPVPESEPEFEDINTEELFAQLAFKLAKGEVALIEIPDNVVEVVNILNKEDFDYAEIAEKIEGSPVLVGEFLRAANSAKYSRGSKITNIRVILPRLGRTAVKSMLYLSTSKMSLPNHPLFSAVAANIVDHCMVVGRISEYLSQRYFPDQNQAFLAGLLHDIGKIAVLKEISEKLEVPEDLDVEYSESLFRGIFPELHVGAGSLIAGHWELEPEIIQAIEHHHDETFEQEEGLEFNLAALVSLSDTIARMLGFGRPIGEVDLFGLSASQALGINRDDDTVAFMQGIMELFEEVDD